MSKKECLDDMFLNRISIIVGQEDENQIKQEIEQIGYKEFYRYNQEKRYMIEQQKIEIKNKDKEIERLNNIRNKAIEYINKNWGHWCSNHCKYATETINILKGVDKE